MKPLIPLLLLLLGCYHTRAQKIHFTDTANSWVCTGAGGGIENKCYFCEFFRYGADTVMYGATYRRLLDSVSNRNAGAGCSSSQDMRLFVREDTAAGVVYYRQPALDTVERVLYNYTLQPGDSIRYTFGASSLYEVDTVVSIDSTLINGVYHKTLLMKGKYRGRGYLVVEGIGTTNSPVWPAWFYECVEFQEHLTTFQQHGVGPAFSTFYYWCNTSSGFAMTNAAPSCGPISVPVVTDAAHITIAPNPAHDQLSITTDEPFTVEASVALYDVLGKRVLQDQLAAGGRSLGINTSQLPGGMYLVVIRCGAATVKREKVWIIK